MTSKAQGLPIGPEQSQPNTAASAQPEARFTQLYEQNFDFVWRSVRMMGVPPDAADDAAQDVFLVAHRRLADFEGRSSPRTWLFAIALRVVSDHRRSRRRKMRLLQRVMGMAQEPANNPFNTGSGFDNRAALLAALDTLPDEQRAVIVLADIEEMSAPEIAAALEVNLNTVYSRLRSARKSMAARMRQLEAAEKAEQERGTP